MNINLNRHERKIRSAAGTRLIDVLRDEFGLTSAHDACAEGVCGACTVLIDGEPVRACLTLAGQVDGREILTVEAYRDDDKLAALQDMFVAEHALQCGYCTPGMMAVVAALLAEPEPPRDEAAIRERLSSVVCRCTGYASIVRAVSKLIEARP